MLSYDDRLKIRDALLESKVIQNSTVVKDEIDEIRFSDIYDKAKKEEKDTNVDKPTVDEPTDIDLFDEGIDYSDYIEFDEKDEDKMFSSSDIDDIIAETDKVMKTLTESEDHFEDNIEALFESDDYSSEEEGLFVDGLTEAFDGINDSILNEANEDVDGLTESVILEEAEAYAMLDELSEQLIREVEGSKTHNDYYETRKQGLYEDEDDAVLPVDDDLDGEAEDYIDPEDVALVEKYLDEEPEEDNEEDFVIPVDEDEPVNQAYSVNPEADVDDDGIPDIDEPHGELPADYEPNEYNEFDHGYAENDVDEVEPMEESDDLSFLFESDDADSDDDNDDDDNDDNDNGDEGNNCSNNEDDDEDDEDDGDDIDFDDDDDDDDDDDSDKNDNDDDEDDDDDDNDDDDDDDDDDLDISFDEEEEGK